MIDLSGVTAKTNEPLPAGNYLVRVTKSSLEDTMAGGKRLAVMFTVQDEEHKGRKVSHSFNVVNSSKKAEEIGKSELKGMLQIMGLDDTKLESPADIVDQKVRVLTGLDDRNGQKYPRVRAFVPLKAEDKSEGAEEIF